MKRPLWSWLVVTSACLNSNLANSLSSNGLTAPIKFGYDSVNDVYGYLKAGADTVTPFSNLTPIYAGYASQNVTKEMYTEQSESVTRRILFCSTIPTSSCYLLKNGISISIEYVENGQGYPYSIGYALTEIELEEGDVLSHKCGGGAGAGVILFFY